VAFDRLRGEVALLRRAVADMAAARTSIEIPNYQPTLERTEKVLGLLAQQVDGVRKSPAMQITPETLGDRVNASVTKATSELRSLVQSSKSSLDGATRDLSGLVASARHGDEQNQWLYVFGIGGVVLGLLLYAVLAGPIARMMPASWLWPERMATRVLGESDQWDAGQRLMQRASPQSWHLIVVAAPLADGNRQEIEKCSAAATKAKKPVRCAIEVKPVIGGEVAGLRRRKSGIESHRLLFLVPLGPISTNDGTEIAPNIGNGRAVIEAQGAVKFSALTHPQVQESEAVRIGGLFPFFLVEGGRTHPDHVVDAVPCAVIGNVLIWHPLGLWFRHIFPSLTCAGASPLLRCPAFKSRLSTSSSITSSGRRS
jgi:hypothetical protein